MINTKYIVLVDDDGDVYETAVKQFEKENEYQLVRTSSDKKDLKEAMLTIPDLLIINEDNLKHTESRSISRFLKKK